MTPRHAVIVGAGPGLGVALARRFLSGGAKVSLIARAEDRLATMATELQSDHQRQVAWRAADAGQPDALTAAIAELSAEQGAPDVLIYNAAVLRSQMPLELAPETLLAETRVNLVGALAAAQAVAPAMVAAGRGTILFTGGGLALEPYPEWTSLAIGKAGLRSLSFSLYKDLSPKGVHVSVIAVCGLVAPCGLFDPDGIAEEYWRLSVAPEGLADRERIIQPAGSDPFYNDPERRHRETTVPPMHLKEGT